MTQICFALMDVKFTGCAVKNRVHPSILPCRSRRPSLDRLPFEGQARSRKLQRNILQSTSYKLPIPRASGSEQLPEKDAAHPRESHDAEQVRLRKKLLN